MRGKFNLIDKRIVYRLILGISGYFAVFLVAFIVLSNVGGYISSISEGKKSVATVIFSLFVAAVFVFRAKIRFLIQKIVFSKYLLIVLCGILTVASIIFRISFIDSEYVPVVDQKSFYSNAKNISKDILALNGGNADSFPFLMTYRIILGLSMFLGFGEYSHVVLNLILDIIAAVVLFLLISKSTKSKRNGFLSAVVYFSFPLVNIYSVFALPISYVNMSIIVVFYSFYGVVKTLNQKGAEDSDRDLVLWVLLSGAGLNALNIARPFAIIFIIAMGIYLIFKKFSLKGLCILISMVVMLLIGNALYLRFVDKVTHSRVVRFGAGWNTYVGSNFEHKGFYNNDDSKLWNATPGESGIELENKHRKFFSMGMKRYFSRGIVALFGLLADKAEGLVGRVYVVNDFNSYPKLITNRKFMEIVKLSVVIGVLSLFGFGVLFWSRGKTSISEVVVITLFGLFIASMFVEVSNRYFMPFLPLLIILIFTNIDLEKFKTRKP